MDLVRHILISTERGDTRLAWENEPDAESHVDMMNEAGLIHGSGLNLWGITWDGFELLDAIRDNSTWNKMKERILESGMSWTISLLKAFATQKGKEILGIPPND